MSNRLLFILAALLGSSSGAPPGRLSEDVTSLLQAQMNLTRRLSHGRGVARQWRTSCEEDVAQSDKLSEYFEDVASSYDGDSPSRSFLRRLRICGQCQEFRRFGNAGDGGYLTCINGSSNVKEAYSLGVDHYDKWSDDVVASLQVHVNQLDCTSRSSGYVAHRGCTFFEQCVVSDDRHEFPSFQDKHVGGWSLLEMFAQTGQANATSGSLLMKMDIEGSEWAIFEAARPDVLSKFRQIIVEFHDIGKFSNHQKYDKALQNVLLAGFEVVHIHGNNHGTMYKDEETGSLVPQTLEVTFLQGAQKRAHCLNRQQYMKGDARNYKYIRGVPRQELPMATFTNID